MQVAGCRPQVAGCRLQAAGCRLQVAGCTSEFAKRVKCPEWFTDLPELLKQNMYYNGVLVISYSRQGHTKLEISDLSSINQFFSPRSFKAKRRVLKL